MESDYKKKQWIVAMLAVALGITIMLHLVIDPAPQKRLHSPAQLDSLILQAAYDFSLGPNVRVQTIPVDSLFTRKNYRITVPPGFSKTTFHMHLNGLLYPYKAQIHGYVHFPERNLDLHILYNNTVHRSVRLRTDPELLMQSSLREPEQI